MNHISGEEKNTKDENAKIQNQGRMGPLGTAREVNLNGGELV